MSRTVKKKKMKFKLLYFSNKVGYRAGNMHISQNAFYPMKIKLQNPAGNPVKLVVMQVNSIKFPNQK